MTEGPPRGSRARPRLWLRRLLVLPTACPRHCDRRQLRSRRRASHIQRSIREPALSGGKVEVERGNSGDSSLVFPGIPLIPLGSLPDWSAAYLLSLWKWPPGLEMVTGSGRSEIGTREGEQMLELLMATWLSTATVRELPGNPPLVLAVGTVVPVATEWTQLARAVACRAFAGEVLTYLLVWASGDEGAPLPVAFYRESVSCDDPSARSIAAPSRRATELVGGG